MTIVKMYTFTHFFYLTPNSILDVPKPASTTTMTTTTLGKILSFSWQYIYIIFSKLYKNCFLIHNNLAPVHGGWSNWGLYGKCSKTCGRGTKTRRRICNNPPPKNGGLPCRGSSVQTASCNPKPCRKF